MTHRPTTPSTDPRATPRFHVRPPANWANDPNGPVRWGDTYHLFFQHNPYAPTHGDIHWGHSRSADLAHWEHQPVALAPTPGGPDEAGCWSGCVVDDNGTPTAVYSGVGGTDHALSSVCLAYGDAELREWRGDPVPVVDKPDPALQLAMFRDPFVFHHEGRRWALVGAGRQDGTPAIVLYECDDLRHWREAGVLLDGDDPLAASLAPGTGWECPQLLRSGDEWVLVLSLWDEHPLGRVSYLTGQLIAEGDDLRFHTRTGGVVDQGRDFYAPAVLQEKDRALLWGWSWESHSEEESLAAGWAGLLTFPRELSTHPDGSLRSVPAPELAALRAEQPLLEAELTVSTTEPYVVTPLPAAYELSLSTDVPTSVGLLTADDGELLALRLDPTTGSATLDRSGWPAADGRPGARTVDGLPLGALNCRLYMDGSVLEVFLGEHAVLTERVYPRRTDRAQLTLAAGQSGPATVRVTGWELVPPTRA